MTNQFLQILSKRAIMGLFRDADPTTVRGYRFLLSPQCICPPVKS